MKTDKQTLGEFFQEARKDKGVSIDEVVRDTNIPKKYLESIESNNFDVFPGETYALGFVANYADALEIERDIAIALYKKQMKIAQDAPLEELVGKKKSFTLPANLGITLVIGGISLVVILGITLFLNRTPSQNTPVKSVTFDMADLNKLSSIRFRIGDTIILTNTNKVLEFSLARLDSSKNLIIKVNNNQYSVRSGELLSVDTDLNGTNDMGIEVLRAKEHDIKLSFAELQELPGGGAAPSLAGPINQYREYIMAENEFVRMNTQAPVSLNVVASASGFMSYSVDGQEEKSLNFSKGSTYDIPFSASLVLSIGNSGALRLKINNHEETGGAMGEVTKSVFYWKKDKNQSVLVRALLK